MQPFALVIFGITGNLFATKLLPALYDLKKQNFLPAQFKIIGIGRKPFTESKIREHLYQVLKENKHVLDEDTAKSLLQKITYLRGDITSSEIYHTIKHETRDQDKMFYLATYPELYKTIFDHLKSVELHHQKTHFVRLIIEKPFGHDLKSAQELDRLLLSYFSENQIFRIDHYLEKETLQNILNFRFGNTIFEPIMNKNFIDHIQITAAEKIGIEKRGGYYDTTGALKDVGQNHLLQMLTLATMDCPTRYTNGMITKERINILQNLVANPKDIVFGQYEGYQSEENVYPNSQTDTFFAFKTKIDTERFRNVPIYIRAGKKLAQSVAEIAVVFKLPDNTLFVELKSKSIPNILFYRIQPNEGITIQILVKSPGHVHTIEPTSMSFSYEQLGKTLPSPYERLLHDALCGDQTFFNDAPEIEAQWKFIDPFIDAKKEVYRYQAGSWGPKEADELIKKDGRKWILPQ